MSVRILSVTVTNIGGLTDGRVVLPPGPVAALAGANGTGKSKLLACLLAPWTSQIPSTRSETNLAEVVVELRLDEEERIAIAEFSERVGLGSVDIPENFHISVRRVPLVGNQRSAMPDIPALNHLWGYEEFLAANPSLNVVYLPAERRLLAPHSSGIDLNELSDAISFQKGAESRNAVNNYGRLDDQEFENFAKALCVAASLPAEEDSEPDVIDGRERLRWERLQATVNALISPKEILGLTRTHADQLRIRTMQGDVHSVRDLSSGERQALIIISRVLRAGTGAPLVMIDEPDAYLHPHLSKRLILALEEGVGTDGQLIVATHSPAVLDGLPPAAILRLEHGGAPRAVADETERLDLYRQAGFRSSTLTQSDLLLITEGSTDASILNLAIPELSRASVKGAGGKSQVLREVAQLKPFELPVLGVVDLDLNLTPIEDSISNDIFIWPCADIEGVYLSKHSLQTMIDLGLIKSSYGTLEKLEELVENLCEEQRENVITEIARDQAVMKSGHEWPTPRGHNALSRLRQAVRDAKPISPEQLEVAVSNAELMWDEAQGEKLKIVRGKYILGKFVAKATELRNGRALLEIVARHRPPVPALLELSRLVSSKLDEAP